MAARERVKELLKDINLSMRDIARMSGVTHQRVSQIYRTELRNLPNGAIHDKDLPVRKPGKRSQKNKTYEKTCLLCKKEFVTHIRNIKYCCRKCVTSSQMKVLPNNLPELFINCISMEKLARQLGVSVPTMRNRLVRNYGFTKKTFEKYDRRYKK